MHESSGPIVLADPVDRSHPLNRGRISWWLTLPGLEGGRRWLDLMGLNHGTLTNMTTSASGWRGTTRPGGWGHILFDGSDDAVVCPSIAAANTPPVSYAAWANLGSLAGNRTIVGGGVGDLQFRVQSDGAIQWVKQGVANIGGSPAGTVATNAWCRVVGTYAASGAYAFHLDGRPVGSGTSAQTLVTTNPVVIGAYTVGTEEFAGALDDVSMWSRVLSAAEVRADYDLSRAGYPGVLRRLGSRAWRSAPAGPGPLAATYYQRRRRGA
jgi:hypothetical protein